MVPKNIKKKIIMDWSESFSTLKAFSQNKLYKTCGGFIIGIEFINLPRSEEYRPIIVCYPLWKSGADTCLEEPIFLQEIFNRKGFQFSIPYLKHDSYFNEAIECTAQQAIILSYEDITLKQFFESISIQFSQGVVRASNVNQIKLYQAKVLAALFVNEMDKCKQLNEELSSIILKLDPIQLEWKFGKINEWLQYMKDTINFRDQFLAKIEENKLDKKISKLNHYQLLA